MLRTPHALEKERQKQTRQYIVDQFYNLLQTAYTQQHYEAHQIFAGDEVGIDGARPFKMQGSWTFVELTIS